MVNNPDTFAQLLFEIDLKAKGNQIEALEKELHREKQARKKERFFAICFLVVLLNLHFFTMMPSTSGPIVILILELSLLVPLANMMDIEEVAAFLDQTLSGVLQITRRLKFWT